MRIKVLSLYKSTIKIIYLIEEYKNSLSNQLHYEINFILICKMQTILKAIQK